MLNNYYTLEHLAHELDSELVGHRISSIFTQERSQIVVEIGKGRFVVVSCRPDLNALYLNTKFARARRNTLDLFPMCRGMEITRVKIHPADRIVSFYLEDDLRLEAALFGSAANVVLLSNENSIVDSFKTTKRDTVIEINHTTAPRDLAGDSDALMSVILKREFPKYGPLLIREVLIRSSVSPSARFSNVRPDQQQEIATSLKQIDGELRTASPRIYTLPDGEGKFSIIALTQFQGMKEERFDSISDAVRTFIGRKSSRQIRTTQRDTLQKKLLALLTKSTKAAEALAHDISSSDRAHDYERYGKLLLANLGLVGKEMSEVTIEDGDSTVVIPLQRDLTPSGNAQRYFEKAKRSRSAIRQSAERLTMLRGRIALTQKLLSDLALQENHQDFIRERSKDLHTLGLSEKQQLAAVAPYRIYEVEGGFEVWAGKNSKSNDALTMTQAKPNDLWFHARGAGGSHVVLKVDSAKGDPGKKAKMQAAAVAAYFSKMKSSSMVPVAMTRRKYVRKPRGSAPGTVTIEREEVLMVRPGLP